MIRRLLAKMLSKVNNVEELLSRQVINSIVEQEIGQRTIMQVNVIEGKEITFENVVLYNTKITASVIKTKTPLTITGSGVTIMGCVFKSKFDG